MMNDPSSARMPLMSQLSLYCPPVDVADDEPHLLSFT